LSERDGSGYLTAESKVDLALLEHKLRKILEDLEEDFGYLRGMKIPISLTSLKISIEISIQYGKLHTLKEGRLIVAFLSTEHMLSTYSLREVACK
jgi:hypothetical protein